MKITSVDVFDFALDKTLKTCQPICIRINTDEGISGFGEVGVAYGKARNAGVGIAIDFANEIIGKDPLKSEAIFEHLFRNTFWGMGGGTVINGGMSAVDIALWDIKGKALNQPVWQLLGGKTNQKLWTYASQIQFDWGCEHKNLVQPEAYAEAARKAMAEGFTCIKVDPIGVTDAGVWGRENTDPAWRMRGPLPKHVFDLAVARVQAIRDVSPDLGIVIELHSYTDTTSAVQLGKALCNMNILYCEEPVHPLNVESMLEIHKKIDIPLASGERIYTRYGYRPFFEKRALQVIQPDVCLCGGISEIKKISDMASIYDVQVQIHVCGGPISTAAAMQVESVIPNFLIHELHECAIKQEMRDICKYDYQPVDSYLTCPDLPGIGQELTDAAMDKTLVKTIK
ncbi:MAG: mandelate racemase/muconate lactonizing enzyme family protein [Clostridia bacterium]